MLVLESDVETMMGLDVTYVQMELSCYHTSRLHGDISSQASFRTKEKTLTSFVTTKSLNNCESEFASSWVLFTPSHYCLERAWSSDSGSKN